MILYVVMIGFTVSVVRSLIMFLFRVGADMTGRHYDGLTSLTVSAVVILFWRPLYLYDGGFWLSFGAVGGYDLASPGISRASYAGILGKPLREYRDPSHSSLLFL